MAGGKELKTTISIDGSLDASLKKAVDNAVKSIDGIAKAAEKTVGASARLTSEMQDQRKELRIAKDAYASYVLQGEESSAQAQELADKIRRLSRELDDNESAMNAAYKAADDLAKGLNNAGDEAKNADDSVGKLDKAARDSEGGFTVMRGAIANLISNGIQWLIDTGMNAVQTIYGLAENTREFRQDMGTLETAFDRVGFSAETATDTWNDLYSIFGEDDRAVETANNIVRIADNQQELDKWVTITTGVWGTYQDALPVESLAEAAAETANTGTVTGALADALNWSTEASAMFSKYMSDDVVTAEDAFNAALAECTTEAERQALITDTLTTLYGDAATAYETSAASVMEANSANGDLLQTQAEMGERIEPITTAVTSGFGRILNKMLELTEGVDVAAFADKIGLAFDKAIDTIDNLVANADKIKATMQSATPIVAGLTAAFAAYKVISAGVAAAELVKTAVLASGATTVTAATVATWALNSAVAFLTSPITIAVVAIGALVAAVVWLYQNWDTAKIKLQEFGAMVNQIWTSIASWIGNAINIIGQYFPVFGAYLQGWWSSIQAAVDNVKAIFQGVIDFIGNVFAGNWSAAWENVVTIFKNWFGAIANFAKAPLNGVISAINAVLGGINSISIDVPDWVPGFGGQTFGFNIPQIPMLAKGGFTDGISIAGEAGTEAVISFDQRYRDENLAYWAKAGQMLGVDQYADMSLGAGGGSSVNFGDVVFSPQITVQGNANKQTIREAIEESYPEFIDMLEEWYARRERLVYG